MRAITIKCPECGATTNADAQAPTATCSYCGTVSQIQHRSPVLERPVQISLGDVVKGMPVATQRHSVRWIGFVVVFLVLGLGALPAVCIVNKVRKEVDRKTSRHLAHMPSTRGTHWSGVDSALTVDLNGDGVHDIIGRVRVIKPDSVHFAAFDGKTGKRLWKSERLGTYTDTIHTPSGLTEDLVVVGQGTATLSGLALKDGSTRWRIRLNEKTKKICEGPEPGTVAVKTKDGRFHKITLADGAVTTADTMGKCKPLPSDSARADDPGAGTIVYKWSNDYRNLVPRDKLPGISADEAIHHVPSNLTIALGHKKPGSRIPMIASYRWPETKAEEGPSADELRKAMRKAKGKERFALMRKYRDARRRQMGRDDRRPELIWSDLVPGIDPMTVREDDVDPKEAATNGEVVVVVYQTKKTHVFRLTAFAAKDGKRLWDIGLPGTRPLTRVIATPTHAMVSRWSNLFVYDIKTGEEAYTIN